MEFQDRVIAISGANSGIGRGLASYLALRGARLSLADINGIEFAEGDPEFGNLQKISKTAKMDVRSAESVNRWIEDTVKHFGRLDGAVNCAGVLSQWAPVSDISDEEWSRVLDINLSGTFRCLRAELRHMNEGGSVVNISSISGLSGLQANAGYSVSKHGVIGLTKSAAKEVASKKIRVNCIAPGVIETPMITVNIGMTAEQVNKDLEGRAPMKRMGTVEEAAKAIAFLLSSSSSYMTGSVLTMDGGMTA